MRLHTSRPREVRQGPVQQHQLQVAGADARESLLARARRVHPVALGLQLTLQEAAQLRVVVDDQQRGW